MYSIMIVDDDPFFASVFEGNYDWNASGFTFAAHAGSGSAAIEYLHRQPVDLVFVDMCMPGMNGPELIGYISTYFPRIQCVALSNYDDFDFVKESFRLGACDYVLKHCLNRQEMHRLLSDFLKRRGESRDAAPGHIAPDAAGMDNRAGHFLSALLEGAFIQDHDDYRLWDSMGLPHCSNNLLVIQTEISHFDDFRKKYYELNRFKYILRSICSILRNILDRMAEGVVFYHENDECFYSILCGETLKDPGVQEQIQDMYIQQVKSAMKMYFNVDCISRAAPLVRDVRDIRHAYRDLLQSAGREYSESTVPVPINLEVMYSQVLSTLKRSLKAPTFEDARRYIARCYEEGRRLRYRQEHYTQLTMTLYRVLLELGGDAASREQLPIDLTPLEMERFTTEAFSRLYDLSKQDSVPTQSSFVQSALEVIHQNYAMPTLSLNTIAETVHVSPAYLSRSFKSEVGTGISEYINWFRVERAQSLFIIEHLNVKTVATRCGFESYNYFFRIFKRYTGLTPKEFCEHQNPNRPVPDITVDNPEG